MAHFFKNAECDRNLLNQLEEHILIINKEGIITFSNHTFNILNEQNHAGMNYSQIYGQSSEISRGLSEVLNGSAALFSCEILRSSEQGDIWFAFKAEPILAKDEGEIIDGAIILCLDITNQKRLEQALRRSEDQYRLIAENSRDLIKIIDREGYIEYASPSHKYILGQDSSCYLGTNVYDSIHPDDLIKFKNSIESLLVNKRSTVVELRKQHKEGHWIWLEASCSPAINQNGEVQSVVLVTRDITDRKQYEKKLEYMAYHDFLTGLYNRRRFQELFEISIQKAVENNSKLALLMLDIDNFKWINDNLGHDAGDHTLQQFAKHLMNCRQDGYIVGRLSGDEFAVLMNDLKDRNEVIRCINRITVGLEGACVVQTDQYKISTSIGISIFPEHAQSSSQIMKYADLALYKVKRRGKRNYRFYDR